MKSRHKITLLFTLLVTAILLVVSFSVYYFTALERENIFRKRLKSRATNSAQIYSYFPDSSLSLLSRINAGSTELLSSKGTEIYSLSGHRYYRYSSNGLDTIGITPEIIQETIANREYFFRAGNREVLSILYSVDGKSIITAVAAYDLDGWNQLEKLKQIFVISLLIGAAITLLSGYIFSNQLVRPIAQIIREVNDISSHNLSKRIHTGRTQDELHQLANTFNELLDRLQESFTSQRRFISNASHELSTPLTSISSQLQVSLQRDRNPEEYRRVMQSVQEDVMQMRQLTKSLLEIAKTGSQGSIELNEVRIDEVLFKVMADMKKINTSYEVEVSFNEFADDSNFLVFGNSDLLYIAVKNLVENGCKYSPDNTSKVNLSVNNQSTVIEVKSAGEGISKEEMEHIFQPFYRSSNAAGTQGFGLGLALAKRIAGLHKGTLQVRPEKEQGNIFIITLPTLDKENGFRQG